MSTSTRTPALARIIAASLATGALGAAATTFGMMPAASEARVVGAALVAFATGWAMLARLTARRTTHPQQWAYVPAALLAATGTVLLVIDPGEPVLTRLARVWGPALAVLAVWMHRRARRDVPGRARLLILPVTTTMVLAGVGATYQSTTEPPTLTAGAVPGRLVDVGGYRLHLSCTGSGSPTVVLLNGLGETSPQWARVAPTVARDTRVCAYDRAGQGWSDDSPHPADATHTASDLHRLLTAAGEPGPYVLAGHSSGGVHALTYTHLYPNDVAGVVLLDSASPHQVELVETFDGEYEVMRRALAVAPTLVRFGVGQLTLAVTTAALPGEAGRQASVFANSPRGLAGMRAEQAALPRTFRQAQALTTLGSTPLVVLTAKDNVDHRPGWGTAQDRLAALSTNARHVVADLDHMAFLEVPAGAALSAGAIDDVVAAVRTGAPLRALDDPGRLTGASTRAPAAP